MKKAGCINNKVMAFLFRGTLLVFAMVGLAIRLAYFDPPEILYYCSTLSSILAIVVYLCLLIGTAFSTNKNGVVGASVSLPNVLHIGVVVACSFNMLIRGSLLAKEDFMFIYDPSLITMFRMSEVFLHYVVPSMCIIDWLLFVPKGNTRWYHSFVWLILPATYLTTIFILAYTHPIYTLAAGRFPYPMFNVDERGRAKVTAVVALLGLGLFMMGEIFVILDRFIGRISGVKKRSR